MSAAMITSRQCKLRAAQYAVRQLCSFGVAGTTIPLYDDSSRTCLGASVSGFVKLEEH
jgi:hypothetical protein